MSTRPAGWTAAILFGVCLIAAAGVLLLLPIHFYDLDGSKVSCGSVLAPVNAEIVHSPGSLAINGNGYFAPACDTRRQARVMPAALLGVVGAVLTAGALVITRQPDSPPRSHPSPR